MQTKTWTRIEIGYELCSPPPDADPKAVALDIQLLSAALPNALADLCKCFDAATRLRWALGGSSAVNSAGTAHEWVGELLTSEINAGLAATGTNKQVSLGESKLLKSSGPTTGGTATADKPVGTRCILLGDRWINYRSYRLHPAELGLNLPNHVVFFASLLWPCDGTRGDTDALLSSWLRSARIQ